jgi:hypothetical protein
VNLVEPGTLYGDRVNEFDMRLAKIIRIGRTRTNVGFDLYNLLNSSAILSYNQAFSTTALTGASAWLSPSSVLQPRFSASRFWPASLAHRATLASQVLFTSMALQSQPVPERHLYRQWTVGRGDGKAQAYNRIPAFVPSWGMTELVAPGIFGDPHSRPVEGALGRPSLAHHVRISDPEGRPVKPGDTGEQPVDVGRHRHRVHLAERCRRSPGFFRRRSESRLRSGTRRARNALDLPVSARPRRTRAASRVRSGRRSVGSRRGFARR